MVTDAAGGGCVVHDHLSASGGAAVTPLISSRHLDAHRVATVAVTGSRQVERRARLAGDHGSIYLPGVDVAERRVDGVREPARRGGERGIGRCALRCNRHRSGGRRVDVGQGMLYGHDIRAQPGGRDVGELRLQLGRRDVVLAGSRSVRKDLVVDEHEPVVVRLGVVDPSLELRLGRGGGHVLHAEVERLKVGWVVVADLGRPARCVSGGARGRKDAVVIESERIRDARHLSGANPGNRLERRLGVGDLVGQLCVVTDRRQVGWVGDAVRADLIAGAGQGRDLVGGHVSGGAHEAARNVEGAPESRRAKERPRGLVEAVRTVVERQADQRRAEARRGGLLGHRVVVGLQISRSGDDVGEHRVHGVGRHCEAGLELRPRRRRRDPRLEVQPGAVVGGRRLAVQYSTLTEVVTFGLVPVRECVVRASRHGDRLRPPLGVAVGWPGGYVVRSEWVPLVGVGRPDAGRGEVIVRGPVREVPVGGDRPAPCSAPGFRSTWSPGAATHCPPRRVPWSGVSTRLAMMETE